MQNKNKTDQRKLKEFIRVDHAGERGAVKIYEGQLLALNTVVKDDNLKKIIVTGGGRKNYALVKNLQSKFAGKILVAEDINLDGDSLEAEAFGYLAVRSILGKSYTFKNTTGVSKNSSGGILFYYKS